MFSNKYEDCDPEIRRGWQTSSTEQSKGELFRRENDLVPA